MGGRAHRNPPRRRTGPAPKKSRAKFQRSRPEGPGGVLPEKSPDLRFRFSEIRHRKFLFKPHFPAKQSKLINALYHTVISLNFEHIVRPWTIERVRKINIQEGYKGIGIYKPEEVLKL